MAWLQCDAALFQEETRNQPYSGWYCQLDKFIIWEEYFYLTNVTCKGDSFYFTENVDNIVGVVEVIVESVDENVRDQNIIHVNEEYIPGHIN